MNPDQNGDVTHNFLFFFVAMVRANRSSIKLDLRNWLIFSLLSQTAMLMGIFRKLFMYSVNDVNHRGRLRCVSVHSSRDFLSLLILARQPEILCLRTLSYLLRNMLLCLLRLLYCKFGVFNVKILYSSFSLRSYAL